MNAMSWMKGIVVALGISLGGSAMAAGPRPVEVDHQASALYERQRGRDLDNDGFNGRWLDDDFDNGRFDRHERRMFRLGRAKIKEGRNLQLRGETMLQRARWNRSPQVARQAHRLILRGEALEREGRMLVRRARS